MLQQIFIIYTELWVPTIDSKSRFIMNCALQLAAEVKYFSLAPGVLGALMRLVPQRRLTARWAYALRAVDQYLSLI
jgi:hypothetical protein